MTGDASQRIVVLAEQQAQLNGLRITDEEADGNIPNIISLAVGEWEKQKDAFQACLSRNGIKPLGADDLDLMFDNRLSGFKH